MSRDEMIINALVDLVSAKVLAATIMAKNHKETIKNLEAKVMEYKTKVIKLEDMLDIHNEPNDKISLINKGMAFTETQLLGLFKVQSNIDPSDFRELFGEGQGDRLFKMFAKDSWNLLSFMFTNIDTEERYRLLKMINKYLNK